MDVYVVLWLTGNNDLLLVCPEQIGSPYEGGLFFLSIQFP